MTWKPPRQGNYSRVDFYCYQIMAEEGALPVQDLVFNTTDTEVVLSEIPCNIEISFVLSAHNCRGPSAEVSLVINCGK